MEQGRKNTIQAVRRALENVEVHGSRNLDLLLGCMQALDVLLEGTEDEVTEDG